MNLIPDQSRRVWAPPLRSLGAGRAWLVGGAFSVAVHAAMLASLQGGHGGSGSLATRGSPSEIVVRLAVVPAISIRATATDWQPPPLAAAPIAPMPKAPRLLPFSTPTPPAAAEFDETAYLPANRLTARPHAAEYIAIPYPKDANAHGVHRALLAIFIDEDGVVAKVIARDADLPQAFQRAAIDAFSKARFSPGRVGDTPVKSRMIVEVEFDSGDADAQNTRRVASVPGKP